MASQSSKQVDWCLKKAEKELEAFEELLKKTHTHAKEYGITEKDVEEEKE